MTWFVLACCGALILLVFLLMRANFIVAQKRKPRRIDEDAEFRNVLLKWELVVVARYRTVRDVKLFANRVRFLWTIQEELTAITKAQRQGKSDQVGEVEGQTDHREGEQENAKEAERKRERMEKIVAMCGLVEMGEITPRLSFDSDASFEAFRSRMCRRAKSVLTPYQVVEGVDVKTDVLDTLTRDEWQEFTTLAVVVGFPRNAVETAPVS